MKILAVETSCDETAAALVKEKKGDFFVIDEYVSSQVKVHSPFGGVVPNLAAREHLKNLPLILRKLISKNKIQRNDIDLVAVTQGPGLIPALLIGTNAAKALAYAWQKPLIEVHHIAGHIYANFFGLKSKKQKLKIKNKEVALFPILALIVSGGHTELILMKKHLDYKIIGQTLDDAAGEAFDKVAKILELGYPGGPIISNLAEKFQPAGKTQIFSSLINRRKIPRTQTFQLPRPMIDSPSLNFSFSGLKTAVLYTIRDNPAILGNKKSIGRLCAEFQQAVIDVLISKTLRAAKKYKPKTIFLGGGVSANKELRRQLELAIKKNTQIVNFQLPIIKYSLDNAVMIAIAGCFKFKLAKNKKIFMENWKKLEADANLKL